MGQQHICHFPAVSIDNQRAITANKASESGADNSNGISITYMRDCATITVMQIFAYT